MDAVCERLGERWDQNKEACTNEPALKRRWDDLSLQLRQENPDWYDCSQPDETNPPTQPSPWVTTSPTTPITSVIDACARMALPLPRTLRLLTPRDPFFRASWLRLLRTGKGRASDGMLYNGYVDAAMSAPTPRMGRIMQAITMGAIQDNFDIKSYNKGAEDRQYCSFAIRPRTRAVVERMNACEHGSAEREFVDEQRRRVVDGVVERMEKEADPNRFGQYRDEEIYDAFLERERRWITVLRWAKGEAYGVLSCREEYWSTSGEGMRNLEECGVGTLPS